MGGGSKKNLFEDFFKGKGGVPRRRELRHSHRKRRKNHGRTCIQIMRNERGGKGIFCQLGCL